MNLVFLFKYANFKYHICLWFNVHSQQGARSCKKLAVSFASQYWPYVGQPLAEDYPKIQMLNGKVTIEFIPTPGEKYGKVTFTFNKPGKYTVRVSGYKDGASHNFLYLGELTIQDQKTPIYKRQLGASVDPIQKNGMTVLVYPDFNLNVKFDIRCDNDFEMGNFTRSKKEVPNDDNN